jgi:O-antigen/teichoic acid export membrane protein
LRKGPRLASRFARSPLMLTVGVSVLTSALAMARQKIVASVVGVQGLADLSLLLSIAIPLVGIAVLPLLAFARVLGDADAPDYRAYRRQLMRLVLSLFALSVLLLLIPSVRDQLRPPLGNTSGFIAAGVFALGTIGVAMTGSILIFRGDLQRWRRLMLVVGAAQFVVVALSSLVAGREGAVWGFVLPTALIGGVLILRGLLGGGHGRPPLPPRTRAVALSNGAVSISLSGTEGALRQGSAAVSVALAGQFQAGLAIASALTSGVSQFTQARILPAASASQASPEDNRVRLVTQQTLKRIVVFAVGIAITGILSAPLLLDLLFTEGLSNGAGMFRLILLGELLLAIAGVFSTLAFGLGRVATWIAISLIPAVARLAIFFLLPFHPDDLRLGLAYTAAGTLAVLIGAGWYSRAAKTI